MILKEAVVCSMMNFTKLTKEVGTVVITDSDASETEDETESRLKRLISAMRASLKTGTICMFYKKCFARLLPADTVMLIVDYVYSDTRFFKTQHLECLPRNQAFAEKGAHLLILAEKVRKGPFYGYEFKVPRPIYLHPFAYLKKVALSNRVAVENGHVFYTIVKKMKA